MSHERATWWLLGLPIDCITMEQAKAYIVEAARTRTRIVFATPNVNFLSLARRKSTFRDAILRSDLSLVDGMPLVWIARMLGIPVPERVAGSDLIENLLQDNRTPPLRVFFFGGEPGVAEAACLRLDRDRGGLEAAGWHDPGFVSVEQMSDAGTIAKINSSGADFLIVALGAEKGHLWIERNRDLITVPVISHLGAVVNFLAGKVKRAPKWLQRLGLEWVWRVREEPSLAGRYTHDFLFLAREMLTAVLPLIFMRAWRKMAGYQFTMKITRPGCSGMVLQLHGSLHSLTVRRLEEGIAQAADQGHAVTIDLHNLRSIDSRGLGYLYEIMYRCVPPVRILGAIAGRKLDYQFHLQRAAMLKPNSARSSQAQNS
ncbi:MAG: WecB/TagA/CpsF family glycosyltransferase [Gammaproteobacteria bacterium]|nr:WecB/TagA/CpsF family glycosyltransferase [Gammaproteobacteria bacterium]